MHPNNATNESISLREEVVTLQTGKVQQSHINGAGFTSLLEEIASKKYNLIIIRGSFFVTLSFEGVLIIREALERAGVKCVIDSVNDHYLNQARHRGFDTVPPNSKALYPFWRQVLNKRSPIGTLRKINPLWLKETVMIQKQLAFRESKRFLKIIREDVIFALFGGIVLGAFLSYLLL